MTRLATRRDPRRAVAWMLLAQLFFAGMSIGARIGGRGVPWQEVGMVRFFMGAVAVYVVARLRGQSLRVVSVREAWLRSGFGTLSACGTFYIYSVPGLALGDAVTLLATSPIFVALASPALLGERPRPSVLFALFLGFSAQPSFSTEARVVAVGTGAAIASAMAMIWLRRMGPTESGEAIVMHLSCVGFAAFLLGSLFVWKTPRGPDAAALALTGVCGGLAQIAMTRAYSLDHAARVSILSFVGIVVVRVLALPVFGEVPSFAQASGSLLVILSGAILGAQPSPVARANGANAESS